MTKDTSDMAIFPFWATLMSLSPLIGAYIHPIYRLSEVIMYLKNGFNFLADSNISKSATNSLKQIYRTCLITVCFVHNVPSFFAIIVLTLWYIRNTSGMVRGLFGDCSGFLRFVFFDVMTLTCSLCCDRMLLSRTFCFLCSNRPLSSFCHL